jgi:hypothetical protein
MEDVHVDEALGGVKDGPSKKKKKSRIVEPDEDEREEENLVTKEVKVKIFKFDEYKHEVFGVVLEPWSIDLQDDIISPGEIKKASDLYMINFQKLNAHHKFNVSKAYILQNYIAPCDFQMDGQLVLKDSWVLITKVLDEDIWKQIVNKEITGYSIGGRGNRNEIYKEILLKYGTPEGARAGWDIRGRGEHDDELKPSDLQHEKNTDAMPNRSGKKSKTKGRYMTATDGKNTLKIVGSPGKNEYQIYRVVGDEISGPNAILQNLLAGVPKKDVKSVARRILESGNVEPGAHQAKHLHGD